MTKRRKFLASALGLAATACVPRMGWARTAHPGIPDRIFPKRLQRGDTIGLIAPGYAVKPEVLDEAKTALKAMGFKPYHTNRIIGNHGYFSNTDFERAQDLDEMFADPKIAG
ncbi:MAG TPA: LD-carboxypeptidase, partial [Pricia sp.]|nr:LD-carboxypeptidase [Pricia sp.]